MKTWIRPAGPEHNITGLADRVPDRVPGQHAFVVELEFLVSPTPEDGTWFLDGENLISNVGPVCRWCRTELVRDVDRPCLAPPKDAE